MTSNMLLHFTEREHKTLRTYKERMRRSENLQKLKWETFVLELARRYGNG